MASLLKPDVSLSVGLATGAVVYGIYSQATPSLVDVRAAAAHDAHINASRRQASWMAAAVVGGISLMTKDPTVFTLGAGMIVAMDWLTRHANAVNPLTGKAMTLAGLQPQASIPDGQTANATQPDGDLFVGAF